MSPAVRRALAYHRVTGRFPSHIHLDTWSAANRLLDRVPYTVCGVEIGRDVLSEPALKATESDPLWLAAKYLMDRGFKFAEDYRSHKRTSHYIRFVDPTNSDRTALAYRHGGGSISEALFTEGSRVFVRNQTTKFTVEETKGA